MSLPSSASSPPLLLSSLPEYRQVRTQFLDTLQRPTGSNIDIVTTTQEGGEQEQQLGLCHIVAAIGLSRNQERFRTFYPDNVNAIALAIEHLNTGDDSVIPQLRDLPDRCPIRFSLEFLDTEMNNGVALKRVAAATSRDKQEEQPIPCAFLGAFLSAVSIPTSIVTGLLGYPQVSPGATSADLDDKSQYPLFGRTVPSDAGNAVPVVIFIREVLQVQRLAVINVNDAYGNAYVDGMRRAAAKYTPDLEIAQVPVDLQDQAGDDNNNGIASAISNLKSLNYNFIFGVLLGKHDEVLEEAVKQGVAGNGQHNWLFSDSFGIAQTEKFAKGSPLHLAYRGVASFRTSGGFPGLPSYDRYHTELEKLSVSPGDLNYTSYLAYGERDVEAEALVNQTASYRSFSYEAAIALGLSACNAVKSDLTLSGQDHFDSLKALQFDGVSGSVFFDPVTGSRDPAGALYQVSNYVDEEGDDGMVTFNPVLTGLFRDSKWNELEKYIFNDGTTKLPPDVPPVPESDGDSLLVTIVISVGAVLFVFILGLMYVLHRERKRKTDDTVWQVKKGELKFSDPPEVLGRGTFGQVLLAEYRGTQVAVKRVIPTMEDGSSSNAKSSMFASWFDYRGVSSKSGDTSSKTKPSTQSGGKSGMRSGLYSGGDGGGMRSGMASGMERASGINSWGNIGNFSSRNPPDMKSRRNNGKGQPTVGDARNHRKLKEDFVEEMRYLSRLRHPCVTTVMGAVIDKHEDPMLIMEYMEHGSLYDLLHNETMAIDGEILLPILRDISQGVRFLHSAEPQVLHGDLKAQNILVDSRFHAKVADFGLSQKKNMGGTGSPFWMAPELLRRQSPNTSMSDVYSFGIILYEVYSRKDPYEGERANDVLRDVANKDIRKRPVAPPNMPTEIKALMLDCLSEEPENRPTFEEIDNRLKRIDADTAVPTPTANNKANKRANSQVSLFDIFPRHVAEAMRDGRKVEAEHKEMVTIFFSDIIRFTDIASRLEPQKIANMLDRLYYKFDELSTKYDLYKVETIGDSYMAVTNLVKNQSADHCKRIAEFAIEAIAAANQTLIDEDDSAKGCVNIRVGFHSGPVVADVVGSRNPRYCLFGDAVNTASRMESNSGINRINCSESSAHILQQQSSTISLKDRGELFIKGKGKMKCFWVNEDGGQEHAALERVRTNQKLKFLQTKIETWSPPPPVRLGPALPEQHPKNLESVGEVADHLECDSVAEVSIRVSAPKKSLNSKLHL